MSISRRAFLQTSAAAGLSMCLNPGSVLASSRSKKKPNIVIIYTDDLGWGDLSLHGAKNIKTPHIDHILQRGLRCTNGYVASSICGPSRSALLTARQPARIGIEQNWQALPTSETTMADLLKQTGYHTALIGKWHQSGRKHAPEYAPTRRGFDYFKGGMDHSVNTLPDETMTDFMLGIDYLKEKRRQPSFLYLATGAVHTPLPKDKESLSWVDPKIPKDRKPYVANVLGLDRALGAFIEKMDKHKLWDNTLLWFINDNGGKTSVGASNAPFRAGKYGIHEGGVHVPFSVMWKDQLPENEKFTDLISAMDVLPTTMSAVGVNWKPKYSIDGIDMLGTLKGENKPDPNRILYWQGMKRFSSPQMASLRWRNWRYYHDTGAKDPNRSQLYDISSDPGESKNQANSQKKLSQQLHSELVKWQAQLKKDK